MAENKELVMKYKHTDETKIILEDLINRVQQFVEVSQRTKHFEGAKYQIQAFQSVLTLLNQVKDNGHVFRGNDYFPDDLEPLVETKFTGKQLRNKS